MDIDQTIKFLASKGIESFKLMNVLVIPIHDAHSLDNVVSTLTKLFKEINYTGYWRVDPYYYRPRSEFEF